MLSVTSAAMSTCTSSFQLWYVSTILYLLSVFLVCAYLLFGPLLDDKLKGWISDTYNLDILSIHFHSRVCIVDGFILCFTDNAHTCPNFTTWLVEKTLHVYRVFFFKKLDFQNSFGYYFLCVFIWLVWNRLFNFQTKQRNIMIQ